MGEIKSEGHNVGLLQLLETSVEESSEDEDTSLTHPISLGEAILDSLSVTKEVGEKKELMTRDQVTNSEWCRAKKGRITASRAKTSNTKRQPGHQRHSL